MRRWTGLPVDADYRGFTHRRPTIGVSPTVQRCRLNPDMLQAMPEPPAKLWITGAGAPFPAPESRGFTHLGIGVSHTALSGYELVGGSIDDVRPRLGKLHEALGLAPLLDRWIGDCSAGMRQRIAIAGAFAGGHSLVILDEPFNWLDPVAIFDLREVLRDRVDAGLTLITALHDLGTLASACDAGLMLAYGKVALALGEDMLRVAAQNPQAFERQTIDRLRSGSATPNA